ncbi:MAG: hypothetical protein LBM61_00555 [Prevotellaceae bacterium]|jgi:hypothetical protein|nr:hypothetical protein [Prevotellaceae bacterium]
MKRIFHLLLFSVAFVGGLAAQNDYLVTTKTPQATLIDENVFVDEHFPRFEICNLQPGMRFMYVGDNDNNILATLKDLKTKRDVSDATVMHKIFTLTNVDEVQTSSYSFSTRFLFIDDDSVAYYHEVKDKHLAAICAANRRAYISNLAFINDVDSARTLLLGHTLYTKTDNAYIDVSGGSQQVKLPINTEVIVTDVGVGSRECPVKIVFEDKEGKSYYREVAFSGTNSGLLKTDFVGANLYKYFPNVFGLNSKVQLSLEAMKEKYTGRPIYPKVSVTARYDGVPIQLLRYDQFTITNVQPETGTMVTLTLRGTDGKTYTVETDTRYNVVIKNSNYINDLFGFDNLRKRYPYITEDHWRLLSRGEVTTGMTKDECRLSLGPAVQIVRNTDKYETWFYTTQVLEFEGNILIRIR